MRQVINFKSCQVQANELLTVNVAEAKATRAEDVVGILSLISTYPGVQEMNQRLLSDISATIIRYTDRTRKVLRFCIIEFFALFIISFAYSVVAIVATLLPWPLQIYFMVYAMLFFFLLSLICVFLILMKNLLPRRSPSWLQKVANKTLIIALAISFVGSFIGSILFSVFICLLLGLY